MRNLLGVLTAMLCSVLAYAQGPKQVELADYALWADAPDIQAKASALRLKEGLGIPGARVTIGQSAIQFYKSTQGNQTVGTSITTFADGKDSSCDVNIPVAMNRTDLETMEQALHLDGQIMALGAAIIARWKMPDRQPPVLLKVVIGPGLFTTVVQQFEAAAKDATQRH